MSIIYSATHTGDNGLELDGVPHSVWRVWEDVVKCVGVTDDWSRRLSPFNAVH